MGPALPSCRFREFAMKRPRARLVLGVALVSLSVIFGAVTARPAGGQEPRTKPPAAGAAGALKVADETGKEVTLSPEGLAKLPRQSVKVKDRRAIPATYEGVALGEVLRSAGVKLGKDLRGPLL